MIRCELKRVFYDSMTNESINPEYLLINEGELEAYLKEHPMPKDEAYSEEDLKYDLLHSNGMYVVPINIKEETVSYLEDLLNSLI